MIIKELYTEYLKNYIVDTDTRSIRKNTIFFCLKGENFDGNKFAKDAIDLGARLAVIDNKDFEIKGKTILVDNVLKTLQKLANYHRKQLEIPVIGLTGSNGKTTTKELINCVLKTQYNVLATKGNLNNHIGVPLTLLSITNKTEIAVIEMGANHQKEIEFLCSIAEPDFGYITNFGKAHLEGFGGIEGVIKGKSELYTFLKETNGTCFVNPNDEKQLTLTEKLNRILLNNEVSLMASKPFVKIKYKETELKTQLIGSYNYTNILAAITIGEHFNIEKENIIKAIENYIPTNNRSQIIEQKSNKIILDAYNANPSSVKEAINHFSDLTDTNKIVILGDMFELGEYSYYEHENIIKKLEELNLNYIVVGEHFYKTSAKNKFKSFTDLKTFILEKPIKNKTLLIKGSRGMALERLLEVL